MVQFITQYISKDGDLVFKITWYIKCFKILIPILALLLIYFYNFSRFYQFIRFSLRWWLWLCIIKFIRLKLIDKKLRIFKKYFRWDRNIDLYRNREVDIAGKKKLKFTFLFFVVVVVITFLYFFIVFPLKIPGSQGVLWRNIW